MASNMLSRIIRNVKVSLLHVLCRHSSNSVFINVSRWKPVTVLSRGTFVGAGFFSFFNLLDDEEEISPAQSGEDFIINTIRMALVSIERNEAKKAEQLLHLALKMAQETQNRDGVTYCYDVMANLAYQQGEVAKAEKLFKETMSRVLADGKEKDGNDIVHMSLKLASIYVATKRPEEGEIGFKFCIDNQEKKIKNGQNDEDTKLLLAMSYDWFSHFLMREKRLQEAKLYLMKAYEISEEVNGATHVQTLVLLNDLGSVCSMTGDYDDALSHLQKAIKYGTKAESEDLASFYVNVGAVYIRKGLIQEAVKSCLDGRNIARQTKNKDAESEAAICLKELKKIKLENVQHAK